MYRNHSSAYTNTGGRMQEGIMARKDPVIKNQKVKACNVSNLITSKSNLRLSLNKCSRDTRIRSSLLDIFVG